MTASCCGVQRVDLWLSSSLRIPPPTHNLYVPLQFRPDTFFWSLAVLLRKACIALVNLFFRRSANFQLAAILLVMFLAYTAQVR